ncbi:MAG: TIGR03808 family TAT-translocated repetitive protein [Devosia sp.]|nr:TIGR03808 family TAT-translocated repetitive protein [Devosia sp.]
METSPQLQRRQVLGGLAALLAAAPAAAIAKSTPPPPKSSAAKGDLLGIDFGIIPGSLTDQSKAMQAALGAAHDQGRTLVLPAGQIFVQNLEIPGQIRVVGQPGATVLVAWQNNPIGTAQRADDLRLEGVGFSGAPGGSPGDQGLLGISDSVGVRIVNCRFLSAPTSGLLLRNAEATIEDCTFDELDVAIFSHNSRGLTVRGNRIGKCGNGGILIWRDAAGADGSIVLGNRISQVLSRSGGNGQNGNGINIFKADNVIVADNVIDDCDFSAVRANSTRNVQIRGNTCTNLREVAIYSEFAFSGSVIANNVVDGAAAGISITNLDQGGKLAVCSGNIVRNITPNSPTNPDVRPYGIYAEADTAITGNAVSNVPGIGIAAGYGAFLRNVLVADNVISDADTGVGVSVVEKAGAVRVAGNLISGAKVSAIAGYRWNDVASPDLVAEASKYPNVTVEGNTVSP